MKKLLSVAVFITACYCLSSCSKESYSTNYDDPTIYSSSANSKLEEVIFFIVPYIDDNGSKRYVMDKTIRDLLVSVNDYQWEPAVSYRLDTAYLSGKSTFKGYRTTTEKLRYPFKVKVRMRPEDGLTTAGDYVAYLKDYFTLQPGSYICNISSFELNDALLRPVTVRTPALYMELFVEENRTSASLGEFEVQVY